MSERVLKAGAFGYGLIIRSGGVLDHEPCREVGDLVSELGFFHTGEDLPEVFVGVGSFVDGIFSAIEEDVVLVEFLINGALVQGTCRRFSSEDSASSVVDGVAGFLGSGERGHDD